MSLRERKFSRREVIKFACGWGTATFFSIPLCKKFIGDAMAAGEAKPPHYPPELESLPQRQELEKPRVGGEKKEGVGAETQELTESPEAAEPTETRETLATTETPGATEAPVAEVLTPPETGIELLDPLGLRGKVVYIVYGRPQKHGVPMWGSLGLGDCCRTAEESWGLYQERKEFVSGKIDRSQEDFLGVINPVYDNEGDLLTDDYVDMALKLAPQNRGLVALDFKDINLARTTIERLEATPSKKELARLAISFDAEHFPYHQVDARAINQFSAWFAQKHHEWAGGRRIPGLVFIYVFPGSRILNMQELVQYYLDRNTLVVPIFDGYGTKGGKLYGMGGIIRNLPNTEDFPALLGGMEFRLAHGNRFDKCTVKESFETLVGAPTYFFASQ